MRTTWLLILLLTIGLLAACQPRVVEYEYLRVKVWPERVNAKVIALSKEGWELARETKLGSVETSTRHFGYVLPGTKEVHYELLFRRPKRR